MTVPRNTLLRICPRESDWNGVRGAEGDCRSAHLCVAGADHVEDVVQAPGRRTEGGHRGRRQGLESRVRAAAGSPVRRCGWGLPDRDAPRAARMGATVVPRACAQKLTLQGLETLAVIAYKQPVTALEVSEIRGVNTSGVLSTLLERHLIKIVGRKDVVGRPFLCATTQGIPDTVRPE